MRISLYRTFSNMWEYGMSYLKSALTAVCALFLISAPAIAHDHGDKPKADIVDTAIAADGFNTLVAALQAADLVDTLKGEGPFTVFAPTDEAFAALPEGALDDLLKPENKDQLVAILTYHVVSGKYKSGDLAGQTLEVTTVQGTTVSIDATDGVKVDGANVVAADIKASNGVIHVIDAVITP
ncbi:MAG: fasciclin domain-containing protein [Pseudomonadota bacterium]